MSKFATDMEVTARDYDDNLSRIEGLEQNVIQHIRTSGIRKPRETSLIDELLDIRKERRKLFSSLSSQVKTLESINQQVTEDLTKLKEKQANEASGLQSQLSTLLSQKNQEHESFDQKLRTELEAQEEKLKFMERLNIDKVKKKCEERIKLVEAKVLEVMEAKKNADLKDAKTIALDLVGKAKAEMEKKCLDKIAE